MLRLALCFVFLLLPLPVHATTHRAAFVLPAGARVQVAALSDGYTVGLHVDGLEARQLERALLRLHAEKLDVLASRNNKGLAYVQFAERVVAADARLGSGARGRATQVHLQVTTESPRDVVLAHVLDAPLPVPKTLETDTLAKADDAFVHRRLAEAELLLKRIQASGLQRAWVMLRLGDLAVFNDRVDQACSAYNEAQADGSMRTASTLAALRARVLGCSLSKHPRKRVIEERADGVDGIDWGLLLRRIGRDDPIGLRVAQEARWALTYERDSKVLQTVLALTDGTQKASIDSELRFALLARHLRRSDAFALTTGWLRGAPLANHPEAFDLALIYGRAWCSLDAPEGWQPPKQAAKSWLRLGRRERARLIQEVSACAILEGEHSATLGVFAGVQSTKPGGHLARIKARLEAAQLAMERRMPRLSAHTNPPPLAAQ